VEDHPENRLLISELLESYGFSVQLATNGAEAVIALQNQPVDLVLMDMQMPIMDGYEATRIIRERPEWGGIPVIAMTAHYSHQDRNKCLACGCNQYVPKPFTIEQLLEVIRECLNAPAIPAASATEAELIQSLIPLFLAGLNDDVAALEQALAQNDYIALQKIGHGIKGTAGMYQRPDIQELGRQIEAGGRTQDPTVASVIAILKDIVSAKKVSASPA
jgi:CheY-like chemotaxis protein